MGICCFTDCCPLSEDTLCGSFNTASGAVYTLFSSQGAGAICGSLNLEVCSGVLVTTTLNFAGGTTTEFGTPLGNTSSISFNDLESVTVLGTATTNKGKYCIVSRFDCNC